MRPLRIEVRNNGVVTSRGTCWWVSSSIVVTAFHIVGRCRAPAAWCHWELIGAVDYFVIDGETKHFLLPLAADTNADVALLHCAEPPLRVTPLALSARGPVQGQDFSAIGFPDLLHSEGFALTGEIARVNGISSPQALQLRIRQSTNITFAGISGSAVMVADEVVGVVTEETSQANTGWAAHVDAVKRLLKLHHDTALVGALRELLLNLYPDQTNLARLSKPLRGPVEYQDIPTMIVEQAILTAAAGLRDLLALAERDHAERKELVLMRQLLERHVLPPSQVHDIDPSPADGQAFAPRVLIAGPFFGLTPELQENVHSLWTNQASLNQILETLRHSSVEQAQIEAIARHRFILDLSPWRGFARWLSDGLREGKPDARVNLDDPTLVHFVEDIYATDANPEEIPESWLSAVRRALQGERVATLVGIPTHWSSRIEEACLATRFIGGTPNPREITEIHYLRALRVVAGQVERVHGSGTIPLRDVWMDVEIARHGKIDQQGLSSESAPEESDSETQELQAALRDRETTPRPSTGFIVSSETLPDLGQQVFIWGAAGTGKSTLLRRLAAFSAEKKLQSPDSRLPLWIPEPASKPSETTIVSAAITAVHLPVDSQSPLWLCLAERLRCGEAQVFVDSLDEADAGPERFIDAFTPALRWVFASRPTRLLRGSMTEVELKGLAPLGIDRFLTHYFGGGDWVGDLLSKLRDLPDGWTWMRIPVRLLMAASLYRRRGNLPSSVLDLYADVLGATDDKPDDGSLARPVDRIMEDSGWPRSKVLAELENLANRMFIDPESRVRQSLDDAALPFELRSPARRSGLFTGGSRLKFAHLTFGEYLAARTPSNLGAVRALWRSVPKNEALEVYPMAHAYQGLPALVEALDDARHDVAEARLLRLLLRALRYGGAGVLEFCEGHAAEVLHLVLMRMASPSGRYGEVERRLMESLEPALVVMAPFLRAGLGGPARYRDLLEFLLELHGEVGTEAHMIAWMINLRAPCRRDSRWWSTVYRIARTLVRCGITPANVSALTAGGEARRDTAVRVLGLYPAYHPLLSESTWDEDDSLLVREYAIGALRASQSDQAYIRERLWDDQQRVRAHAVRCVSGEGAAERLQFSLLDRDIWIVCAAVGSLGKEDPAILLPFLEHRWPDVRRSTIKCLAGLPAALPAIRKTLEWAIGHDRGLAQVGDAAVAALHGDPEARGLITAALATRDLDLSTETLLLLVKDEHWRVAIAERARNGDTAAIRVLAGDLNHREFLRRLLHHSEQDIRIAAIQALSQDEESWPLIAEMLDPTDIMTGQHIVAVLGPLQQYQGKLREIFDTSMTESADVGIRSVVLQNLPPSPDLLRSALFDRDIHVRWVAADRLSKLPAEREAFRKFLTDKRSGVQDFAWGALAAEPMIRQRLRASLRPDYWPLRLALFEILIQEQRGREHILTILRTSKEERASTFQPLSRDPAVHQELCNLFPQATPQEQITLLDLLAGSAALLKTAREMLSLELVRKWAGIRQSLLDRFLKFLGGDDEAMLKARQIFDGPDLRAAAAVAAAVGHLPDTRTRLLELIRHESANVSPLALSAAPHAPEVFAVARELLDTAERAFIHALALHVLVHDDDSRDTVRDYLTSARVELRRAAFEALSKFPEELPHLRDRVAVEQDDELRVSIASFIAKQPGRPDQARDYVRRLLNDPVSGVRLAATRSLRMDPCLGVERIETLAALRPALELAGTLDARLNDRSHAIVSRLAHYIERPTPLQLDDDPEFAETILGWLCVRLCWAAPGGRFGRGHLLGEIAEPRTRLLSSKPLLIRVAGDISVLPRERAFFATHNSVEVWRVARYLTSKHTPTIILACTDVAFGDLSPPTPEPGEPLWGPTYFGIRIGGSA